VGDLLARQQLAWPVEEHQEHLEGLGVQLDAQTLAAKLSCGGVHLKDSEAITLCRLRAVAFFRHGFQTSVAGEDRKQLRIPTRKHLQQNERADRGPSATILCMMGTKVRPLRDAKGKRRTP